MKLTKMQPKVLVKTLFSGFFFTYVFFPATNITEKCKTVYCIFMLFMLNNGCILYGNCVIKKDLWIVSYDNHVAREEKVILK